MKEPAIRAVMTIILSTLAAAPRALYAEEPPSLEAAGAQAREIVREAGQALTEGQEAPEQGSVKGKAVAQMEEIVIPPPAGTIQKLSEEERKKLLSLLPHVIKMGDSEEKEGHIAHVLAGRLKPDGSAEVFSLSARRLQIDEEERNNAYKNLGKKLFDLNRSPRIGAETIMHQDGSQTLVGISLGGSWDEFYRIALDGRLLYTNPWQVKPEGQKRLQKQLSFWINLPEKALGPDKAEPEDR